METENLALKEFIKENLKKGYIRLLQLLIKYPVLFIPKKNGKLRTVLKFFLTYKLMEIENLALKKFIKENLKKGYI